MRAYELVRVRSAWTTKCHMEAVYFIVYKYIDKRSKRIFCSCVCSVGGQGPESQVEPVHSGGGVRPVCGAVLLLTGRKRSNFLKSHPQIHTTKPSLNILSPHPFMDVALTEVCEVQT